MNSNMNILMKRILDVVFFGFGGCIFIYYLFDWRIGPNLSQRIFEYNGPYYYYYTSESQLFITLGMGLIILGILFNKWQRKRINR